MPRIPEFLLECVAYFYPTEASARDGDGIGASGFLVGIPSETVPSSWHAYAVTNRHVINAINGDKAHVRVAGRTGDVKIHPIQKSRWIFHPDGDDIAVHSMGLIHAPHPFRLMPANTLLNQDAVRRFSIGPGDETVMLGRFREIDGRTKHTPSVRFGNISMMPHEPIFHYHASQKLFIVEARSIAGYSGSPVLVTIAWDSWRTDLNGHEGIAGELYGGAPVFTLGVDCGHVFTERKVLNEDGSPSGLRVHDNTGMMLVVPAWRLTDILQSDDFRRQRSDLDKALRPPEPAGGTKTD